jgi:rhomboid family protein
MGIRMSDDNSDRTITPFVNGLLLVSNIMVFVLLHGMGTNDRFTPAFSTASLEIVSGKHVVPPAAGHACR